MKKKYVVIIIIFVIVAILGTVYFLGENPLKSNDEIVAAAIIIFKSDNQGVNSTVTTEKIWLEKEKLISLNNILREMKLYKNFSKQIVGSSADINEFRLYVDTEQGDSIKIQYSDVDAVVKITSNGGQAKLVAFSPFGAMEAHLKTIERISELFQN